MEPDALSPTRPGWWSVEAPGAGPGTDYLFSIDGGPWRPDPRSPFQPDGPEGPSRVVDHSSFEWGDAGWGGVYLPGAVLYELHIGTFTEAGTFDAAIGRLGYLAGLGIDAVELLPVAEAGGRRGWGYDGVDWYAPHHVYGGPDGLKRFVDAAHRAGIGVVLDVVYNHLGPAGNYLGEFGPYFSSSYTTNWGAAVNFDGPYSDEVRRFVCDNALMWLGDYHVDGLRLDAVHAIYDHSAVHLLEQLSEEVRRLAVTIRKPLFLVAESDLNDPRVVRPREANGYAMDSAWADEFHHALHAVLTGERSGYYEDFGSLGRLATALRRAWVYAGEWSPHRVRTHGREPEGLSADRFVVFLQNHDQVGNRAAGDRIGALAGRKRAEVGAALVLLSPFVPLLFQGEEWLSSSPFQYFTDHQDAELGRAVSEGRRSEFSSFGWDPQDVPDPQDETTFRRSKLDWEELDREPHREVLSWYRDLISLRRRLEGVGAGPLLTTVSYDEGAGWLVMRRPGYVVVVSFARETTKIPLGSSRRRELLLASGSAELVGDHLALAAESVAVLAETVEGT